MTFIDEFYKWLRDSGMEPVAGTTIIADDKRHRFSTAGSRSKRKDVVYCLNIIGEDFAYGYARDYYQGIKVPFSSRTKRRMTADERDQFKAQMNAAKAKAELESQLEKQEARRKAEKIWQRSIESAPPTEYELRKKINRHGMRVFMGRFLVVPLLDHHDEIMAVQMIAPDGTKRFNTGSEKAGYWFRFGPTPVPDSDVRICEGVATGASIFEAVGGTVYCAFDEGNLLPVAKKLSKKYNVIICADNDAGRVINGKYENIGLLRAQEVAEAVTGRVCAPPDEGAEQPPRSRDFNDIMVEEGIEAVREALGENRTITVDIKEVVEQESWRDELIRTNNGFIVPNSLINIELTLDNHPHIQGVFSYDEFALRVIVKKCPPWERQGSFVPHDLGNNDLTSFLIWCEHQHLKPSKDAAWDMIVRYAHRNSFHPAREYFNSLKWDESPRLQEVLVSVYHCTDNPDYLGFIFKKWLTGAVKRIFEPGCKFDNMIIFEGPQYIGKSRSLKMLATFGDIAYFSDGIKDIQNKDTLMTMQGKLILEFAELSAWRAAETNELKAFMTREVDMYRAPYERTISNIPRQCVFAGTTNPTGAYFRDVTGNRRFWPVYCTQIDFRRLEMWKDQLWAEAVHLYKNGEQIWLNDEEYKLATQAQQDRMQEDAWMEDIQTLVEDRMHDTNPFLSNGEIYMALGIEKPRKDEYTLKRIQKVMTSLGWSESRSLVGGKKPRGWRLEK